MGLTSCCKAPKSTYSTIRTDEPSNTGKLDCSKMKPSTKALKIGGVVLVALLAIGATLAAHYGVFGQSAQHFLNNKILSPIQQGMTSGIPGWAALTALGGTVALTGLFYGSHKLYQHHSIEELR